MTEFFGGRTRTKRWNLSGEQLGEGSQWKDKGQGNPVSTAENIPLSSASPTTT